jgi:hypothetical protein
MFKVVIDTCVWLDLAEDQKQTPLLLVIENIVKHKKLSLVIPRIVYDEFHKNRSRIAKASARSLANHLEQVKEAVNKATTDPKRRKKLLTQLDDVNHKIPIIGGAAEGVLDRVDRLMRTATIVETSDAIKVKATDRALSHKAPCHHENKNSLADAIIIETYFETINAGKAGERFAFVTHNKSDFSLPGGNQKLPHPDFTGQFSKIKSMYFINLAELLRRVDPGMLSALIWEQMWEQEPRGLSELLAAHEILWKQVWYNRHKHMEWMIENGELKLVSNKESEKEIHNNQHEIVDDIWKDALKAAKRTERELGKDSIGPWTDFDWGMINGKLSAIRWMLGDDWDMLDT